MNIHEAKKIYMIGIKGVGMTALAEVLHGWGKDVSGSDVSEVFMTDSILMRRKIPVMSPFAAENIGHPDLILYSTAYSETNPEIAEAKRRGIPMFSYPEALGQLMGGKYGIAVAGSHGKTTTTALLGHVMTEAGLDPTVIVGSVALNWDANARVGQSDYVLIEADEYQNKFQYYNPKGLLITNIDWDHPDYFPTKESYERVFEQFVERIRNNGGWVVKKSNSVTPQQPQRVIKKLPSYRITELPLSLSGVHNRQNIALVHEVATRHLDISEETFWTAIQSFKGTARRFEMKGTTKNGVMVMDDYAHHPTEIRATLSAVKERFPEKKIWAVFQPHTFTRTKQFLDDFARSFTDADHVILLDIYGSAREQQGGVSSKDLVSAINSLCSLPSVGRVREGGGGNVALHTPTIEQATTYLQEHTQQDDLIITLGAGDVWQVGEKLVKQS